MIEFLRKLPGSIPGPIWFLLVAAFSGIVGNRADSVFIAYLPYLIDTQISLWIVLLIFFPIVISAIWFAIRNYRSQQAAIKFVRLDDTLFNNLSSIDRSIDLNEAEKNIINAFLEGTLELFADGCRIHILRPDPQDNSYIKIWHSYGIPRETVDRTQFYVGIPSPDRRSGIAGKSYREKKIYVVKIEARNRQIVAKTNHCTSDDYISFAVNRREVPYKSFISVPIIDGSSNSLGVLCIDSRATNTFDPKAIRDLIDTVAVRIATIIAIFEKSRNV